MSQGSGAEKTGPSCARCAPFPCSCPSVLPDGPCCQELPRAGPPCSRAGYMLRAERRVTQPVSFDVASPQALVTLRFGQPESHPDPKGTIAYNRGLFHVCEAGLYQLDVTVCVRQWQPLASPTDSLRAPPGASNFALGVVPHAPGGFAPRFVYARVPPSPPGVTQPSSSLSVSLSAAVELPPNQVFRFVARSLDPSTGFDILSAQSIGGAVATFVSVRLICVAGPGCC